MEERSNTTPIGNEEGNKVEEGEKDEHNVIVTIILVLIISFYLYNSGNDIEYKRDRSYITIKKQQEMSVIVDGHITRTCEQLLDFLDEEPKDIETKRYEPHIPNRIQQDIDTMLNSDEELDIIYTVEGQAAIRIEKSKDAQSGIRVKISWYNYYYELNNNLSFYRNGNEIVVYGSEYDGNRELERHEIDTKSGYESSKDYYMDLFGTQLEYQYIRYFQKDMSLVVSENNFMFQCLGEQIGEIVPFPGGIIKEMNYHYIMSEDQTLYYLYFCSNKEAPWIRLVKVDDNVVIEGKSYLKTDTYLQYPIYNKDGKRYAGISNFELEKGYGQSYRGNYEVVDVNTLNFNIEIIELTDEQVSKVVVQKRYEQESEYDWYLLYCYEANGQTVYEEKRINGLDSYLTTIIPEERLNSFEGMEVLPTEAEEVVKELKEIYEEYER